MQVNGASLQAYVPQVFGESPITVTAYMGEQPTLPGMGWVMFQGGNPEFPVWMGVSVGGDGGGASMYVTRDYRWLNQIDATDPGHGKVKVNQLDPALATFVYLSTYDLDENAYLNATSLQPGDMLAIYISGNIDTRIEYTLSGQLTNNTGWLTFPVTVAHNYGFQAGTPGNNVNVKVVVQTLGHTTPMPGGVAGDIIIKNSAAPGDASWTKTIPNLTVTNLTVGAVTGAVTTTGAVTGGTLRATSGTELDLASTAHGLQIGPSAGVNLAADMDEIQARNNGAASTLSLNPHGGTIQLGAGGTPAQQVRIGDDAYLSDINEAHTMALVSTTNSTMGYLKIGGAYFRGLGSYWQLSAPAAGNGYLDGDTIYLRNASGTNAGVVTTAEMAIPGKVSADGGFWFYDGGADRPKILSDGAYVTIESRPQGYGGGDIYLSGNTIYFRNSSMGVMGTISASNLSMNGAISAGGNVSGSAVYASNWLRVNAASTGVYSDTHGVGVQFLAGPWVSVYGGLGLAMDTSQRLRLSGTSDDNHHLRYSSDAASTVHPSSGIGSNGPWLQGYGTVCLRTAVNARTWLFDGGSGNAFTPNSWTVYSSLDNKTDIKPLDPKDMLAQVLRWKPIAYRRKDDGVESEGFAAEEMADITPSAVGFMGEQRKASGIDYGKLSVTLAGAVQALTQRIEQLEGAMS